ncbi:hypothetical protein GCM10009104_14550 [Marinobacterium maritimum]|uniref:Uncharacterized protein n=1 Tax=Marinobacterium maritimum TaxID=500162 RepID=A0ABN1I544_9GAMM
MPFVFSETDGITTRSRFDNIHFSVCQNCENIAIWIHDKIIYPDSEIVITRNPDMPPHIMKIYDEALSIVSKSPKGSAALLRLFIQHLCKELGEPGKDINSDIASLVKK